MSSIIEIPSLESAAGPIVPVPRVPVAVRPATPGDLPFIDQLQKMHTHMVGWMPAKQLAEKVERGHVLVAACPLSVVSGPLSSEPATDDEQRTTDTLLGYIISQDQYAGRDDVGIVYQLNVMPLRQRNLVGATLVKEALARAAYGCRLFGCWCAQDIRANFFWESVGFIPLAFRTGSRAKQRIHIYWQRRVREEESARTPYWFPFQTGSGAVREDRLVIPIPQGTHWRDVMPVVLPGEMQNSECRMTSTSSVESQNGMRGRALGTQDSALRTLPRPAVSECRRVAIVRSQSKHLKGLPPGKAAVVTAGGIRYLERGDYVPEETQVAPKPRRAPRAPAAKHDPKQIAAARELRDRYLESVNTNERVLLANAKYEVGKGLPEGENARPAPMLMESRAA